MNRPVCAQFDESKPIDSDLCIAESSLFRIDRTADSRTRCGHGFRLESPAQQRQIMINEAEVVDDSLRVGDDGRLGNFKNLDIVGTRRKVCRPTGCFRDCLPGLTALAAESSASGLDTSSLF